MLACGQNATGEALPQEVQSMTDAQLTVCLTFDVDGMSAWIGSHKTRNPSMISRGEFTIVGTPRVLELLRKYDVPARSAFRATRSARSRT